MTAKTMTFYLVTFTLLVSALVVSYQQHVIPLPIDTVNDPKTTSAMILNLPIAKTQVKASNLAKPALTAQRNQASTGRAPLFMLSGDQLSVHANQVPLGSLLQAIASKSGIHIAFNVPNDDSISADFTDVPLLTGLRQLTASYDAVFNFDASKSSLFGLSSVDVLPKGQGNQQVTEKLHQRAEERQLTKNSHDTDSSKRAYALEQLIMQKSPDVIDIVNRALTDADAQIRFRALNMAVTQGVALSAKLLQDIFQSDTSSEVRAFALSTLATAPDMSELQVEAIAESASNDADPLVATKALEILDQFDYKRSIESVDTTSK